MYTGSNTEYCIIIDIPALPTKLSTMASKIGWIPNCTNAIIVEEFHKYVKDNTQRGIRIML